MCLLCFLKYIDSEEAVVEGNGTFHLGEKGIRFKTNFSLMLTFIPGWYSLEKEEGGFHLLMAAIIQSRFLLINPAVNIPFLSPCQSIFFQQSKTSIFLKFSPSLSDWEKTPIFFSHKSKVGVWVEGKSNTGRSRKSNKQVPKRHRGFYGAEGICCP